MGFADMSEIEGFILQKDKPTQRQYAAIGRVSATWAEVEWGMECILSRLALSPALLGYILTDKLGPDNRLGAIESLVHVHATKYASALVDQKTLQDLSSLVPIIRKMKDDRNFIVHSVWTNAGEDFLARFDIASAARSGKDLSGGPCERLSDIEKFADEVRKLADRLWRLSRQIPKIDATLLEKFELQEQRSRLRPHDESTRRFQRRSYARLQRDLPSEQPKEPQRRDKKAHRAAQAAKKKPAGGAG